MSEKPQGGVPASRAFVWGIMLGVFFISILNLWLDLTGADARYQCRKKNDVFACKMIAVPVGPSKPEVQP